MKTHGLAGTPTYKVWQAMHQRCANQNCRSYPDYGGRGISVSEEWHAFEGFVRDMGMKPPGATLDRIDNSKGYEKANCRWSSPEIQNQNRRSSRMNPDLVREVRQRISSGERARVIARSLGIPESTISMVANRHTWKNIK